MTLSNPPRHRAVWLGCGALALSLAACAADKPQVREPGDLAPAASSEPMASQQVGDGGTTIRLSPEIMRDCRFPASPDDLPRFDVADASLKPRGRDVLADVANCMKDGPLQNRTITIIGRTDARGTEKNNQALGGSRADATRNYLKRLGVSDKKLLVVSRGEEGAKGTDEDTMATDRRVDLVLGDATERTSLTEHPPANPPAKAAPGKGAAYSDQAEGGRVGGQAAGSSGPGTDGVSGK